MIIKKKNETNSLIFFIKITIIPKTVYNPPEAVFCS